MPEPTFDADGYPTDETLKIVEEWPYSDLAGLFSYLERAWHYRDWGWKQYGKKFDISTGGWSGNESLIDAFRKNQMAWVLTWQSSRRGGHYEFEIPEINE